MKILIILVILTPACAGLPVPLSSPPAGEIEALSLDKATDIKWLRDSLIKEEEWHYSVSTFWKDVEKSKANMHLLVSHGNKEGTFPYHYSELNYMAWKRGKVLLVIACRGDSSKRSYRAKNKERIFLSERYSNLVFIGPDNHDLVVDHGDIRWVQKLLHRQKPKEASADFKD